MSNCNLKHTIRLDDKETNEITRLGNERWPLTCDTANDKLYRLKVVNGTLTQQEVKLENGALIEIGNPVTYKK